ncbi:hypothetical protein CLOM_g18507 [Closterium sp. NIES-68]|nr:hypothetical protein CLOM_g18507 [Closterium sp. NIES-68]GJP66899.1 hypothetical protein CLOP_g23777 [Closterium sp. NIES-67]GJP69487.1 hypothetical protein CLOP_g493 [Closterium sp. NIES-67]
MTNISSSSLPDSTSNADAGHSDRHLVKLVDLPAVNPSAGKFPYCLVWTPLPVIAWLVPFIGHLGICREDGTILDFAGSYFVCVDNFAFGAASRYLQLDPAKACLPSNLSEHICSTPFFHADYGTSQGWDQALAATVRTYQHAFYNIFTSNCHSFVACCLNRMAYKSRANWNVVELAALMFLHAKWVSNRAIIAAFAPFVVVMVLGIYSAGITFVFFWLGFSALLVGWFVLGTYGFKGLVRSM